MATAPRKPDGFDAQKTFEGIYWHQSWELFQGVRTPGSHSVELLCANTRLPADLTGRRVLDIGAWNGSFSFECERRGAREVVAYSLENPNATGFTRLKSALGSRVEYVQGSVYALSPAELGSFDLVLFFGVLYHLRYPLLAIDRIRTVSTGDVLIETHTVTNRHLLRPPLSVVSKLFNLSAWCRGTPLWRQYGEFELNPADASNWFGPNVRAVVEAFDSAGFDTRHLESWGRGTRSSFHAKVTEIPARLADGTYEGQSTLNAHLTGLDRADAKLFTRT